MKAFQEDPDVRVALISIKAGGVVGRGCVELSFVWGNVSCPFHLNFCQLQSWCLSGFLLNVFFLFFFFFFFLTFCRVSH